MGTQCHNLITRLKVAGNLGDIVADAQYLYGVPGDSRLLTGNNPYAGTLTGIKECGDGDLQQWRGAFIFGDIKGDG